MSGTSVYLDPMLEIFLDSLDVRIELIRPRISANDKREQDLLLQAKQKIDDLKKGKTNAEQSAQCDPWNVAYRIERLLALVEPEGTLAYELNRRIDEAQENSLSGYPRLKAEAEVAKGDALDKTQMPPVLRPGGADLLRTALVNTLEELQWAKQRKYYVRPIKKKATQRIVLFGLLAFLIFTFPYLHIYFKKYGSNPEAVSDWAWLALYTSLTGGLFGAFFSRLLFVQSRWENLTIGEWRQSSDVWSLILRGSVGMCGSLLLFFFLRSGVMTGSLFPPFQQLGLSFSNLQDSLGHDTSPTTHLALPSQALALLAVWSVMAGFSERLVPSILSKTESTLENAGGQAAPNKPA